MYTDDDNVCHDKSLANASILTLVIVFTPLPPSPLLNLSKMREMLGAHVNSTSEVDCDPMRLLVILVAETLNQPHIVVGDTACIDVSELIHPEDGLAHDFVLHQLCQSVQGF